MADSELQRTVANGESNEYVAHSYLTDDRHTVRDPHALTVAWAPNGDYYIGSVPEGEPMIRQGVRICTSGGAASKNPKLLKGVRMIFEALGGFNQVDAVDSGERESASSLFRELWRKAASQPGYDDAQWRELLLLLGQAGVDL